jgi:hypothetical protein
VTHTKQKKKTCNTVSYLFLSRLSTLLQVDAYALNWMGEHIGGTEPALEHDSGGGEESEISMFFQLLGLQRTDDY